MLSARHEENNRVGPAAAAAPPPSAPVRPRPGSAARGLPADAREAAGRRREGPRQRRPVRPRPHPTRGRLRPPERGPAARSESGRRSPLRFFFFFFLSRQRVSAKKELPTAVSLTPRGRSLPFFSPFSSLSLKPAPSPLFQSATEITARGAGAAALPSAPRCSPCPEPTPGAATCCVPLSLRHGEDGGPPPAATAPRKRGAMRAHLHRCTQQQRLGGVGHLLQK